MCEGASKQSPDHKNYTTPGPRPPVLKFLDPPLIQADGQLTIRMFALTFSSAGEIKCAVDDFKSTAESVELLFLDIDILKKFQR